jgi:hypothetical protein
MFDLEKSIVEWRRQMSSGGIKSSELLDELESHLRDDLERQIQSGLNAQEAFETAVRQLGQPAALKNEFAKVGPATETRLRKLKRVLLELIGIRLPSPFVLAAGAQRVLELGGREALGFHHDFIGTEHVLLGLLESESGPITGVLHRLGVDRKAVRSEIEKIVGLGSVQRNIPVLRQTPRVKKALELARREAKTNKQNCVGPEHIFLGLLLEGGGVAALVLKNLGVNASAARHEILKELNRSGA